MTSRSRHSPGRYLDLATLQCPWDGISSSCLPPSVTAHTLSHVSPQSQGPERPAPACRPSNQAPAHQHTFLWWEREQAHVTACTHHHAFLHSLLLDSKA